jgi:hypothetical protein
VIDTLALLATFALLAGWGVLRVWRRRAAAGYLAAFRATAAGRQRARRTPAPREEEAWPGTTDLAPGRGLEVAEHADRGEFDDAVAHGAATIALRRRDDPVAADDPLVALTADLPLRELTLALYRARGYEYEALPVGPPPWSGVLRHRRDPRRSYALLCADDRCVGAIDIALWRQQARGAGLHRLLVVTERGVPAATELHASVRVFDRAGMHGEMRQLGVPFAAKLIAYARAQCGAGVAAREARRTDAG